MNNINSNENSQMKSLNKPKKDIEQKSGINFLTIKFNFNRVF